METFFDSAGISYLSGEHDLKTSSGHEQRIQVADIVFHPRYDPNTYNNDLALVKLSTKARINSRVKTACLPDQNTTFATGTKCYISGWGLLREYGRGPQVGRSISSLIISSTLHDVTAALKTLLSNSLAMDLRTINII